MARQVRQFIDGKEVIDSGSFIIPAASNGAIEIGSVRYQIAFQSDGGDPSFNAAPGGLLGAMRLVFSNFDNPLGTHVEVSGVLLNGTAVALSFVIYGLGAPPVARLVYYSVVPAGSPAGLNALLDYAPHGR